LNSLFLYPCLSHIFIHLLSPQPAFSGAKFENEAWVKEFGDGTEFKSSGKYKDAGAKALAGN